MSINFANLKITLQQYVEDDGSEYAASLPRIIKQGEVRVAKDLDLEFFTGTQSGTVSTQLITIPANMISVQYLTVNDVFLQPRSEEYLADYGTATGQPLYYNVSFETSIRIRPIPDQAYSYGLKFRREPEGLSNTNTSTWISNNVSEALIYACLLESEAFLKADPRIPIWTQAYADAIDKFAAIHPELKRKVYP